MKKSSVLLFACLSLTVFSGILRGRIDYRWGASDELIAAAERVGTIPMSLGDWVATEKEQLSDSAVKMLRCTGNLVGAYANPKNELVSMVFLVGPAGPLAIHTPDVCYGSNNYSTVEAKRKKTIVDSEGNEHEFSVITFKENKAGNRLLRVYYAWNYEGDWVAPAMPRTAFAGIPMLYKIQVATNAISQNDEESDAGERFLQENLPRFKEIY